MGFYRSLHFFQNDDDKIMNYFAQKIKIGNDTTPIEGPLEGINTLGDVVNKVVAFVLPIAAIILLLVLIWGGYDYLLSRGNPEKIKGAQAKLTSGIIGFIILVFAYVITKFLATILGLGDGTL